MVAAGGAIIELGFCCAETGAGPSGSCATSASARSCLSGAKQAVSTSAAQRRTCHYAAALRLRRKPIAVEAERDALGDRDSRLRWSRKARGVEDDEVGRVLRTVEHVAHEPTIILAARTGARNEHELTRKPVRPKVVDLARPILQIVLDQVRGRLDESAPRRESHAVRVAILLTQARLVRAWKLLRGPVDHVARDPFRDWIDGPALEGNAVGIRPLGALVEHLVVCTNVENDSAVGPLEPVARMEHVAGVHVTPDDVAVRALPWQQAHARAMLGVPGVGEPVAGEQALDRQGDGQIEDQHVVLGDHAVVDHRPVAYPDGFFASDIARRRHDDVPYAVWIRGFVAGGVKCTAVRILVRLST